tara:strand:- start:307 stop:636 length:330 start_codon:yes stop_codon:yes gene_type:complete
MRGYEYSLIPYPYLRPHNLFNAFVLTAMAGAIASALSMEIRTYFIQKDKKFKGIVSFEADVLYKRVLYVLAAAFLVTFSVYIIMYLIIGFGGGMVSAKRKWRFFSSVKA